MDDKDRQERTAKVIAESERLIAEAERALAASERIFTSQGIDREQFMKRLQQIVSPEVRAKADQELAKILLEIGIERQQAEMNRRLERSSPKRTKRLRNMV